MEDLMLLERGAFLLGLFFMVLSGLCWRHGKRLKRLCTEQTHGVVVDEGRSRSAKGAKDLYLPKYSYSVLGVEHTKQESSSSVRKVSTGQNVTVFYDPSNPQRAYVLEIGAETGRVALVMAAIGVVLILLGLLFRFVA